MRTFHAAALPQAMASITWSSDACRNDTLSTCGRLWVRTNGGATFQPTQHYSYKVCTRVVVGPSVLMLNVVTVMHCLLGWGAGVLARTVAVLAESGFLLRVQPVWASTLHPPCSRTVQVVMAENNGRIIYSHAHRSWDRNYVVRVYKTLVGSDGTFSTAKVRCALR